MVFQNFGNRLGYYFEGVACANLIGAHYIFLRSFDAVEVVKDLPTIIVHPSPVIDDFSRVNKNFLSTCDAREKRYPWETGGAWLHRPIFIRSILEQALRPALVAGSTRTLPSQEFESITPPHSHPLQPLIPDSVILFRCIDVMQVRGATYGFLKFQLYDALLPRNLSKIYVITEPFNYVSQVFHRANYMKAQEYCVRLIQDMTALLRQIRPEATVSVLRGHANETFYMLAATKTVICAPSTYCLWPGLLNQGNVYFHPGNVVKVKGFLREQFYWISSPPFIPLGDKFYKNTSYSELVAPLIDGAMKEDVVYKNFVMK
eukprot:gene11670-12735_t